MLSETATVYVTVEGLQEILCKCKWVCCIPPFIMSSWLASGETQFGPKCWALNYIVSNRVVRTWSMHISVATCIHLAWKNMLLGTYEKRVAIPSSVHIEHQAVDVTISPSLYLKDFCLECSEVPLMCNKQHGMLQSVLQAQCLHMTNWISL
jgi:hypothetical protein